MSVRFASQEEVKNWNQLIIANPDGGNVAQGIELANIKSESGWKIRLVIAEKYAITVHERSIPIIGKLWYIPKGPGVNTAKELSLITKLLRKFALRNGVFLIKIEPEIIKNDKNLTELSKLGLIPSRPIQPNSSTVILDISKSTDQIMSELPQKSRHAIKRAWRDGVKTKKVEPSDKNFEIMLSLINQTMADKSVKIRGSSYYKKFWKSYANSNLGELYFAYQNGVVVAGAFVLVYGSKATYKDGGSVRERSAYGASHALQWCIIESLNKRSIKYYDLCGTPPAADINNPAHPRYGIGLFKTSFNKNITEFVGVSDLVVKPFSYKLWVIFGERLIHRFYSLASKMFY